MIARDREIGEMGTAIRTEMSENPGGEATSTEADGLVSENDAGHDLEKEGGSQVAIDLVEGAVSENRGNKMTKVPTFLASRGISTL